MLQLPRSLRALALAAAAAFWGAGCGPPPSGQPARPEPSPVGSPLASAVSRAVSPSGDELAAPDGRLTVTLPAGALTAPAELTIQRISNTAPGGMGEGFRLGPEGLTFAHPVKLTFSVVDLDRPIEQLAISYQRSSGYWVPVEGLTRDAATRTLTVTTTHFSDWAIVIPPTPTPRDLSGSYTLTQTTDIPFTATGLATLFFEGEDTFGAFYLVVGDIVVPASIPDGTATCTPDATTKSLPDSIADIVNGPPAKFRWGINGHWQLACTEPGGGTSTPLMVTSFDSQGINLIRCTRGDVGTPTVTTDSLVGTYEIDCGSKGKVTASWNFVRCFTAPDGTPCGGGRVCTGGVCGP